MQKTDSNEVRLTGAIEKIKSVPTKTGAAMAEIILRVRQDRFRVLAHKNVAEHLLVAAGPNDRLSLTGTVQPSNWKDEATGEWKNSFSIVAWAVEIHGDKISFQRKQAQRQAGQGLHQKYEIPTAQAGDPF